MFPLVSGEASAPAGQHVNGRECGIVGCVVAFFVIFFFFLLLLFFDLIGAFAIWLGSPASKELEVEKLECGCSSTTRAHLSCISHPTPCSCHHPDSPQPHFIDPITPHAESSVPNAGPAAGRRALQRDCGMEGWAAVGVPCGAPRLHVKASLCPRAAAVCPNWGSKHYLGGFPAKSPF